jgi:hypothetical protein
VLAGVEKGGARAGAALTLDQASKSARCAQTPPDLLTRRGSRRRREPCRALRRRGRAEWAFRHPGGTASL